MRYTIFLSLAMLAACSQNPDGSTALGIKGSPAWFMTASPEAIASHYRDLCQNYGYTPRTAEMARCIERNAESGRSAGLEMAGAMSRLGESQRASMPSYRPNRPTRCESYTYSGTGRTTTNCY